MGKKIVIQPVSRIEGHAKIIIQLDDTGNVADTKVNVVELRGFEKFCIGRPVEELPRIVTSICGVCPWSHHLASAKANDAVFGVEPPPAGTKLRDLCNSIAFTEEHILHFFFLAGPDFVMGPDADYSVRNVIGIAQTHPEIGQKVVRNRHLGAEILEIVSGKSIHPVTAVPGGFSKPLTKAERDKVLPMAEEVLEFAKFSIAFAKESIFPKYLDTVKTLGVINTGFMGTVTDDGTLNVYDGKLRLMKPDGSYEDFAYEQYTDYISERIQDWSYLKFPYAKSWGDGFSMDIDDPKGIYRTNALARINVADKMATPLAQKEFEEFRAAFGRPAQLTLLYHWARLIELLYNAEHVVELLNDPEITSTETRVPVTPRASKGIGCTEAPRGTLIHDYETDEKGLVTNVNLIVGTTHNNAPINMSVNQAAKTLIKDGNYDQGILNMVEMSIRAYDPCLSCATHNLDGRIAVCVDIVDADGNLKDSFKN
ncbi:MAG: Ni/Fe hydrogenase subunit alpha [Candidatus Marinimicrobia bacterium]|nr:Ni/Fe hydrogenase subunit alpha [Candidatus Neomarinimicrobiota bacterium]MBL7046340.1 Ni/Fe hydrogenase subunit alpha [Candidatus Neomarinimicrobiota bacterium]